MITPNRIQLDGVEISDEDMVLEVKKTYLYLQKALLQLRLAEEIEEVGKSYERFKAKISEKQANAKGNSVLKQTKKNETGNHLNS